MAWTPPMTAIQTEPLTAAQFNTHVRDNLNETMTAKASEPSMIFVTSTKNEIRASLPQQATITDFGTTQDNEYTDLTTTGPTIFFRCSGAALVFMGCNFQNIDTAQGAKSFMSFNIVPQLFVGQDTDEEAVAPADERSISFTKTTDNIYFWEAWKYSGMAWVSGLEPDRMYRLRAKYKVTEGVGVFLYRQIGVIPL